MSVPRAILLTDLETGEEIRIGSLMAASDFLGRSKQYVKVRMYRPEEDQTAESMITGAKYKLTILGDGERRDAIKDPEKRKKKRKPVEIVDGCEVRSINGRSFQLCNDCARSVGFCSWSKRLDPVEGWTAVPTVVKINRRGKNKHEYEMDTYHITECPLFIQEGETVEERRKQRQMLKEERLHANNNSSD